MRLLLLLLCAIVAAAADIAIPAKGSPAFTLTIPDGWSAVAGAGGSTTLRTAQQHPRIQVWAVEGKRTVDEAVADIAVILTPEVKEFVIAQRTDISVAGAKAMLLTGTGSEADDGDPSHAQATVFSLGGKVWVLVSHGEGDGAAERAGDIAKVLKTLTPAH